ncbi:indole-3-glycerol phosphate synthase TrpC [bacterium]|nr:indole-3-glycerol phosphate synthase TrpC [bacterium]NIN93118.1 indole-3-glycerol phosphate synthase TrpC [bacterium]NIO18067.1 indole-3-glycerol phosphate synthase TrpC [bacterium]NIO74052.1 indole-3-glycerol phosphate synthase TrpC [bacterium]
MDILGKIVSYKKSSVQEKKGKIPLAKLKERIDSLPAARDFKGAISLPGKISLICEIKKASPSSGLICKEFHPKEIARTYEKNGAGAISVLTEDKYFQGDISHLFSVKQIVNIPILRKDFIIDEYQLYESRAFGADALLLIASLLDAEQISQFLKITRGLGMEALVEVHSDEDLEKVLATPAEVIGINNRNLKDFTVDLNTTKNLRKKIPKEKIVVSESGIKTRDDVLLLKNTGINAILIGQVLLESGDIGKKMGELRI